MIRNPDEPAVLTPLDPDSLQRTPTLPERKAQASYACAMAGISASKSVKIADVDLAS